MPNLKKLHQLNRVEIDTPYDWKVTYNQFYDFDPLDDVEIAGVPNKNRFELLVQDLLQIKNEKEKLLLDLGWYPEADPDGQFELVVIKNDDWENPHYIYKTKSKVSVLKAIYDITRQDIN